MKCLIIDDDPLVCDLISHFVSKVDFLEYAIQCQKGEDALNLLASQPFDLLLLDMDMPGISGMELLRTLDKSMQVIIITSSPEFALQSYDYQVVDYLLKPIQFARFHQAVNRAYQLAASRKGTSAATPANQPTPEEIFVKDGHNLVRLVLKDVLFIEAVSNYVAFKTASKTIMSLMSMQKLEESLPEYFVRIHRSYIVNVHKIDKIEATSLQIGDKHLPISTSHKDKLLQKINLLI